MGRRPLQLVTDVSSAHTGVYRVHEGGTDTVLAATVRRLQRAEEAGFAFAFLFDTVAFDERQHHPQVGALEPLVLLTALAQSTKSIGLVPTVSTTFWDPYNFARVLATLDVISGGRTGWNAVTSFRGEWNFGYDELPTPQARYERAAEFIAVVRALWSSWGADALVSGADGSVSAEPAHIVPIDHRGAHFGVRGPLDVPPSPQRWPVQFQAGGSPIGVDFGARYAEVVFTASPTPAQAADVAASTRARAAVHGRPDGVPLVFTSVKTTLGRTESEARELEEACVGALDPTRSRRWLEEHLGIADLSTFDLDAPLPEDALPPASSFRRRQGRFEVLRRLTVEDRKTLRELHVFADNVGHWREVGTPRTVADAIEARHRAGTLDVLSLSSTDPDQEELIYEHLVPELASRGVYEPQFPPGATLRERLRLPAPAPTLQARQHVTTSR